MDDNKKFKPTTEWMEDAYNRLNQQLFNGELGGCILRPFTSGRGSRGNTLGWFKITAYAIVVRRSTRRMFSRYYGEDIDRSNFVQMCKPCIELNANYSWTENAMLATLAHEMCHYYTYMNGICPKQGHGPEFKQIGAIVSARSNGMFTIQRLASAEQMSDMELDADIQASNERREAKKKSSISAIFVINDNGTIELTTTSNPNVIKQIVINSQGCQEQKSRYNKSLRGLPIKVISSNDAALIDQLFAKGYKNNMRAYRYWTVTDKFDEDFINQYSTDILWENGKETPKQEQPKKIEKPKQKRMFCIKLKNGEIFKAEGSVFGSLFHAIKNKFPNWSDQAIKNLMMNPKNYIMEQKKINSIVESVLNEFVENEFNENGDVMIDPNMNLGLESPLEMGV